MAGITNSVQELSEQNTVLATAFGEQAESVRQIVASVQETVGQVDRITDEVHVLERLSGV